MCLPPEHFITIPSFRFWPSFPMKDKWLTSKNFNCKSKDLICTFYFTNTFFPSIYAKNDLKCIISLNLRGGGGGLGIWSICLYVNLSVCWSVCPTFLPAYLTFLLTVSMWFLYTLMLTRACRKSSRWRYKMNEQYIRKMVDDLQV